MSYGAIEISVESGSPIELYQFNFGSVYYRYTSAAKPVTYLGNVFEPATISRGELADSGTPERTTLNIDLFRNTPVCDLFRIQPPSAIVSLTIFRRHETDTANEFVVFYIGRVLGVEFQGNTASLNTEPVFTSLKRTGLRLHYQVGCPHVLYGTGCNLNAALFAITSSVFTVTGSSVFVQGCDTQPVNHFAGGFVEYLHPTTGVMEVRAIRTSSAGNLLLSLPPEGLAGADEIKVYPGCAHTTADCVAKFNNLLNYGGQPFIPGVNPFGGARIF